MNKFFYLVTAQTFGKIVIGALLFTTGYWYFVYDSGSALQNQLGSVIQQLDEQQKKKKDTDATLKQEQEMKDKVGQVSQKYQEISKKLPPTLFSNDINRTIDEIAQKTAVSIKSKKPIETIKHSIVDEVPVEVKIEGTYTELAKFCFYISKTERMTRIKNILISDFDPNTKKLKFEGLVVGYKLAAEEKKESSPKEKTP